MVGADSERLLPVLERGEGVIEMQTHAVLPQAKISSPLPGSAHADCTCQEAGMKPCSLKTLIQCSF